MRSSTIITLIVISFLLLTSCRQGQNDGHNHDVESQLTSDLPEDFLSFYLKFHSDTDYQVEHVIFPLKIKRDGSSWQKEDWVTHKPFEDHDGQYKQSFLNMNGLIMETIRDGSGMYTIERRFIKSGEDYNLIYYKVVNAFENSEDWEKEDSSS